MARIWKNFLPERSTGGCHFSLLSFYLPGLALAGATFVLFIILVKKMLPLVFSQGVLSCSTHPSRGPLQSSSQPTHPASVLYQHQQPLQSSCCSRGSAPNHSMFTTAIAGFRATHSGGQSHSSATHSNHMQTSPASWPEGRPCQTACLQQSQSQPQQKDTQPTQGIPPGAAGSGDQGLRLRAPRDNIYIRLLFKDWEIYLICLIHRNKHKELSKIRRQKHYLPNKRNKTKFHK